MKPVTSRSFREEVSLNPELLRREFVEVMSTLVHEMVHLWQQEYGSPSRANYHNREWGVQMREVGLVPSSTGQPGGKSVGQRMTHYIAQDGPFQAAFDGMPASCKLPWLSGGKAAKVAPKAQSKIKYTCPECGQNAWGKPGLLVLCATCIDGAGANLPMDASGLGHTSTPLKVPCPSGSSLAETRG